MNIEIKSLFIKISQTISRFLFIRRLKLNYNLDQKIQFKIAETQEELEGAFKLFYENNSKSNLDNPKGGAIPVSPYHALDSTTTIIAKLDNKIIGTLSLIRWGALGVPSKKYVNLTNQRWTGLEVAEVSYFALDPEYKNQIFYHLLKFTYNYCVDFFGVDVLIAGIPVKKSIKVFNESVLLFQPLSTKAIRESTDSNSIHEKNVIYESLNLHESRRSYFNLYSDLSNEKKSLLFFYTISQPKF